MLADARLPMRTMLALAAMMGALFLIFVRAAHDKATAPRTRSRPCAAGPVGASHHITRNA